MFILLMLLKEHYTVEGDDTLNRMYFHCGEYNNVKISNHRVKPAFISDKNKKFSISVQSRFLP